MTGKIPQTLPQAKISPCMYHGMEIVTLTLPRSRCSSCQHLLSSCPCICHLLTGISAHHAGGGGTKNEISVSGEGSEIANVFEGCVTVSDTSVEA